MAESLIQKFLNAGLFDIGEDDERLGHFQKAAGDMAKDFAKSPSKLIAATLTAVDADVPVDEPLLIEAETAVKTHWKAFANKYPKRPKGLLRPVILEALAQRANEDLDAASIIWLSGSSLFERVAQTKESAIVGAFLGQCGEKAESEAVKAWAPAVMDEEFAAPKLAFKLTAPKLFSIDHNELQQKCQRHQANYGGITAAASGPIAEAIESVTNPLYEHASTLTEQLKTPLKDFSKEFSVALAKWTNGLMGTYGRRLELLWWKECLYSPSIHQSYRGLTPAATAMVLAEDLNRLCPYIAPQSLECLLRETVNDSLGTNPEFTLSELLDCAKSRTSIAKALQDVTLSSSPQRVCLLTAVRAARTSLPDVQSFPAWLGVSSNLKMPASEWAVWLFRDAQALDLSSPASP